MDKFLCGIPCDSPVAVMNNKVQWSADLRLCCWPSTEMVGSTEEWGAPWSAIRNNKPLLWAVVLGCGWAQSVVR